MNELLNRLAPLIYLSLNTQWSEKICGSSPVLMTRWCDRQTDRQTIKQQPQVKSHFKAMLIWTLSASADQWPLIGRVERTSRALMVNSLISLDIGARLLSCHSHQVSAAEAFPPSHGSLTQPNSGLWRDSFAPSAQSATNCSLETDREWLSDWLDCPVMTQQKRKEKNLHLFDNSVFFFMNKCRLKAIWRFLCCIAIILQCCRVIKDMLCLHI